MRFSIEGAALAAALAAWPFFLIDLSTSIPWRLLPVFAAFSFGTASLIRALFAVWQTRPSRGQGTRVLIYGAGEGGALAARDLLQRGGRRYALQGFIDDDEAKVGRELLGVPILGTGANLAAVTADFQIEQVMIAIPSASGSTMREILRRCRAVQRRVDGKPTPDLTTVESAVSSMAMQGGDLSPQDVAMARLLRRAPRDLNPDIVRRFLAGKTVVITGAGGSIGSEIAQGVAAANPARLVMADMNEENLHRAWLQVSEAAGSSHLRTVLGDVAESGVIDRIIETDRPEIVIHAAAYKHVRLVEENPSASIINNVRGTIYVARAAAAHRVGTMVNISTDKAVRPSATMGATKRLCEIFLQEMNDHVDTRLMSVRFGNVLGSSGSLVPIVTDQIRSGGPVTVTDPDATRFFMLISEAAQLTLQAAAAGAGGEIYVLDMGDPIRIQELVELLIDLHGYQPSEDIQIQYVGLSEGEKLHEELSYEPATAVDGLEAITLDGYRPGFDFDPLRQEVDKLLDSAERGEDDRALSQMRSILSGGIDTET